MSHTPGPWHVEDAFMVINSQCIQIAEAQQIDYDDLGELPSDEEVSANARLIAAAPDLLECVKELFMQMRREGSGHQQMLERALAAISKAEGRSE